MVNISPAEALKILGKWVRSKELKEFLKMRNHISERRAYQLIKKALDEGHILRYKYPDGKTIYGLSDFGPPTQLQQNSRFGFFRWLNHVAERRRKERERYARELKGPALAYFKHRAVHDDVEFYKRLVEEEERLIKES